MSDLILQGRCRCGWWTWRSGQWETCAVSASAGLDVRVERFCSYCGSLRGPGGGAVDMVRLAMRVDDDGYNDEVPVALTAIREVLPDAVV
jgi:hypothetical protein